MTAAGTRLHVGLTRGREEGERREGGREAEKGKKVRRERGVTGSMAPTDTTDDVFRGCSSTNCGFFRFLSGLVFGWIP